MKKGCEFKNDETTAPIATACGLDLRGLTDDSPIVRKSMLLTSDISRDRD